MKLRVFILLFLFVVAPAGAADLSCAERFAAYGLTTHDFTTLDLVAALNSLAASKNPRLVSPELLKDLQALAGVDSPAALLEEHVQQALMKALNLRDRQEVIVAHGQILAEMKGSLSEALASGTHLSEKDWADMHRSYGFELLPKDDPAYRDPTYLARALQQTEAVGQGVRGARNKEIKQEFDDAWRGLAPENVPPTNDFYLSGSDANNSLFRYANRVIQGRGVKGGAEILTFTDTYGAGTGPLRDNSFIYQKASQQGEDAIVAPMTSSMHPTDPREIARVSKLEEIALQKIRERVSKPGSRVGGFLLEPILGARGALLFRPEFLLKLRALCDELKIPIFADEILNSGGRTGKFFSYQNYEGFEPDVITFGKGFQLTGVAEVTRKVGPKIKIPNKVVTLYAYNEALLKSTQLLKRIKSGNLMKNAVEVGVYLVERLKARHLAELKHQIAELRAQLAANHQKAEALGTSEMDESYRRIFAADAKTKEKALSEKSALLEKIESGAAALPDDGIPRGLGMLIYHGDASVENVKAAMGKRLMPPLTLTKEQVDDVFPPPAD